MTVQVSDGSSNKKKKKRKKKSKQTNRDQTEQPQVQYACHVMWSCDSHVTYYIQGDGGGVEDVDAVIREVNELLGEAPVREVAASSLTAAQKSLLSVDKR